MYCGRDWSPLGEDSTRVIGLDFVNDMNVGETLTTATWTIRVSDGVDLDPGDHLWGPPLVTIPIGSTEKTMTIQRVGGLLANVTYTLQAIGVTSLGNVLDLWSHIRGVSPELP